MNIYDVLKVTCVVIVGDLIIRWRFKRAVDKAYDEGFQDGRDEGYNDGFNDGYATCRFDMLNGYPNMDYRA